MSQQTLSENATLDVTNIGGIQHTEVNFVPGVNILSGRNATNRTSLQRALNVALGGRMGTIHGDETEASVELTLNGATYTRNLQKAGKGISYSGDPYTEDSELVDTFASLLEHNKIRSLIRNQPTNDTFESDLEDELMYPVDTSELDEKKRELLQKKGDLKDEINELKNKQDKLPELEREKNQLESELEEVKEEFEEKQAELDERDFSKEEKKEAKRLSDKLEQKKTDIADVNEKIERKKDSREKTKEELEEKREALEEAKEQRDQLSPDGDIEGRISELQKEKEQIKSLKQKLASIQQTIQSIEENESGMRDRFRSAEDAEDLTGQLTEGDSIDCPVCGEHTTTESIVDQNDAIRSEFEEATERVSKIDSEISDLQSKKSEFEDAETTVSNIERSIQNLETEISRRDQDIESLQEQKTELKDERSTLEEKVEETAEARESDVTDLTSEVSALEERVRNKRKDLEKTESEIEKLEAKDGDIDDLEAEREEVSDKLSEIQHLLHDKQKEFADRFNETIQEVIDVLGYDNLEKIEVTPLGEKRGKPEAFDEFKMEVVREINGTVSKDQDLGRLSESEREVVGLITALTGYLVHDVNEDVPMLLIDSMEAIDSGRIATFIGEFEGVADYTVVALLPDADETVNPDYHRIDAEDEIAGSLAA